VADTVGCNVEIIGQPRLGDFFRTVTADSMNEAVATSASKMCEKL
jgi:hypothetical protein